MDVERGAQAGVPRIHALRRRPEGAIPLGASELRLDALDDPLGDLVLEGEEVVHVAVVALGPELLAEVRIHEPCRHAHPGAVAPDAAFEDVASPERTPDPAHVHVAVAVGEGRAAGDHREATPVGERRDHLLGEAVGEVLLVGALAQVLEGQHGHRRPVEQARLGPGRGVARARLRRLRRSAVRAESPVDGRDDDGERGREHRERLEHALVPVGPLA